MDPTDANPEITAALARLGWALVRQGGNLLGYESTQGAERYVLYSADCDGWVPVEFTEPVRVYAFARDGGAELLETEYPSLRELLDAEGGGLDACAE